MVQIFCQIASFLFNFMNSERDDPDEMYTFWRRWPLKMYIRESVSWWKKWGHFPIRRCVLPLVLGSCGMLGGQPTRPGWPSVFFTVMAGSRIFEADFCLCFFRTCDRFFLFWLPPYIHRLFFELILDLFNFINFIYRWHCKSTSLLFETLFCSCEIHVFPFSSFKITCI